MSLPSGYKRLEYIQSSGTQYVNTRITINATTYKRYRFLFDIGYPYIGGTYWLVNGNSGSNVIYYFGLSNAGKIVYGNGTADVYGSVTASTGRYLVDFNPSDGSYKFGSLQNLTGLTFNAPSGSQNFYLFAYNKGNGQDMHTERLYSAKIYDNGTIVRDFIPCQKPDGTIGLWDDVNSVFHGNAGTGTFAAGPVIAIAADASEITKLEYIQSTGTQYVNTGVVVSKNLEIKLKFMLTSTTNNGIVGYIQSASSGTNRFAVFQYRGAWYFDFGNDTTGRISGGSFSPNTLYDITAGNRYIKNNVTGYNIISGSVINNLTNSNSISILCETNCGIGKIYSCQIYDNGTLVRDFIAAKLSDGTVGLYDKLSGLLYINAGTGTFEAGPSSLNLPVNIGGTWKDANEAFINIGGTWKTVEDAFVNIGGAWKKIG